MIEWVSENWLAFYGAVVGSLALLLNVARFVYDRKKDSIQLEISGEPHKNYDQQVAQLRGSRNEPEYKRAGQLEVYKIKITNTGNIPIHIQDAGVVTTAGESIPVLTNSHSGSNHYHIVPIDSADTPPIAPKASQTHWVWQKNDQEPFGVSSYYVVDGTGKRWSKNA